MSKLCTTLLSGIRGAFTIISVRPERSEAKSKDALFVLATVLMVAALAGCGGGGGKTAAPLMPVTGLPDNASLEPGSIPIPAGEKRTVIDADGVRTELTCPADGPDCNVTVGADGVVQYTGGMPTVVTVSYTTIQLPDDHELMAGTIPAGEFRQVHRTFDTRTVVTCPADGADCEVTAVTGNGAESTGGALTVTTYTTLYLPSGHTLNEGTIPAGVSRPIGGYSKGRSYDIVCPFDGEDCVVTLGEYDFESTGGAPTVVAKYNRMVWQANNGPAGTSDGAHARGYVGRLVPGGSLNAMFASSGPNFGTVRAGGSIVQSTEGTEPGVTATASWASSGAAPTLGLAVTGTGSNSFSADGDSEVPSLGTGWNGVALGKTIPTGRVGRAVVYSNIEKQPDGGSADRYYLTLGAWLALPDDPAAASNNYNMGAFANGHSATALLRNTVIQLTGTATYEGPATGLYTTAGYSGSGGSRRLESAEVGSFTATARINADFGATGSVTGRMSGTVTNFMENGESLGNWTVNLYRTDLFQPASRELFYGRTTGSADGESMAGQWGLQFYRNSTSGYPDSAVGVFTASTVASNNAALHLVGAYGADRR